MDHLLVKQIMSVYLRFPKTGKPNIKFINFTLTALRLKGLEVSLGAKLKAGNVQMVSAIIFYSAVGIICFALLPIANFPPHIGIIGVLSLITACGLFKKRVWTIWFGMVLFFVATTFSMYTLYYLWQNLVFAASMAVYLVLTWVFTAYMVSKREALEK